MKQKKCRVCKNEFTPVYATTQTVCSVKCAVVITEVKKSKEWAKKKAQLKKDLMTTSDYIKIAQQVFNQYIRQRDKNELCISCGKEIKGVTHASHYLSSGGHSNIRFNEDNVWSSCYKCNVMLSGNQIEYRIRLIKKIGLERVEWLENNSHVTKKWTIEELKNIINIYKKLVNKKNKKLRN